MDVSGCLIALVVVLKIATQGIQLAMLYESNLICFIFSISDGRFDRHCYLFIFFLNLEVVPKPIVAIS